ncbi:MAG: hypothetical protein HY536_02115 [Candidatus Colwellbacteria bacterium]|nr:hypothetical protein [Candidatus Colwellbacteria bacterium]
MLSNFALEIALFASLGAMVYIAASSLPRIEDDAAESGGKVDALERLARRIPLDKIDGALNAFFVKLLRRVKVVLMRADNVVTHRLNRVQEEVTKTNGNGKGNGHGNGNGLPLP